MPSRRPCESSLKMSRGRSRGGRKRFGDNGFEAWGGYMNAKKSKLEEQFSLDAIKECPEKNYGIFHNVAIFVNGYTGIVSITYSSTIIIYLHICNLFHFTVPSNFKAFKTFNLVDLKAENMHNYWIFLFIRAIS